MKSITTSRLAMIAVAAISLGLAACNDPADDALEQKADKVEASAEATAEAMENKADQIEASGEAKADALEGQADKVEDKN